MAANIPGLWEPYGLKSSPFFQTELRPGDPVYPVSLFVGREPESIRVRRRITSDPTTRTIVQGDPGVGKTSFVNWAKAELAATGIATYEHPIRISSDTTRLTFVADTLRTLLRVRSAVESRRVKTQEDFWERTARMLQGGELTGGALTLAGVGGAVSRSYVAPQVSQDSLFEHLGEALRLLTLELESSVLLHVNNLENVQDPEATAVLIRDLRDYLLLDGAHWIFVGALGIEDEIFRVHSQVSGIFPAAETLEPLAPEEIERLLLLRYEHLRIAGRAFTKPIEPAAAARLYALYQGDLRNFLRLLEDAADRVLGLQGIEPMTEDIVLRNMSPQYERWLRRQIGDTNFGHLAHIAEEHGGADPEFRVTDAATILAVSQPAASQLVERLLRERVIHQTRTQAAACTIGRSEVRSSRWAYLPRYSWRPVRLTRMCRPEAFERTEPSFLIGLRSVRTDQPSRSAHNAPVRRPLARPYAQSVYRTRTRPGQRDRFGVPALPAPFFPASSAS